MPLGLTDAEVQSLGSGGFIMRDGLLGSELALAVAEEAAALPSFRPAGVAREGVVDPRIRGDDLVWLDPPVAEPPALATLCRVLEALAAEVDEAAYLGLAKYDVQVARYEREGAQYERHRDAFARGGGRVLTVIYYANAGWKEADGGKLRVWPDVAAEPELESEFGAGRHVDIAPILDRVVIFLSDRLPHAVLPSRARRLAVTAWFHSRHPLPLHHPPRRA